MNVYLYPSNTETELKNIYIGEYKKVWTPTAYTIGYWELNWNGEDTKNDYWVTTYTSTDYDSNGYIWAWNPTYADWRWGRQCAYFAGDRCLNLPVLPIPSNTITISLWANLSSSTGYWAMFHHRQDLAPGNDGWCVFIGCQTGVAVDCKWVWTTNSSWTTWQTGYDFTDVTVEANKRHNIVFTFNWWTAKLYIDWVLKQTISWKPWLRNSNSSQSFIWWDVNYTWNNYMTGYIQDVIYENRTWSDQDVADYYATY